MARREQNEQGDRHSLSSLDNQSLHSVDGETASTSGVVTGGSDQMTSGSSGSGESMETGTEAATLNPDTSPIHYELVGIVVHSGQANAGHYYSFIRDRR